MNTNKARGEKQRKRERESKEREKERARRRAQSFKVLINGTKPPTRKSEKHPINL